MGLEPLESRLLMAGDVSVSVSGGDLLISGDGDDNQILIVESGGTFDVLGQAGTTVNGGEDITGLAGDILIDMDRGDDRVVISGVDFDGNIIVDGGVGGNEFRLSNANIGGDVSVENGTGKKSADSSLLLSTHQSTVENSSIDGEVTIVHGKATAINKGGEAIASEITIDNNSHLGGLNVTVVSGVANAADGADGAITQITNNASITGDVVVQHGNLKASGYGFSVASRLTVTDNGAISGNVLLDQGNATTQQKGNGLNARSTWTRIDDNGPIGGDVRVSADNAVLKGDLSGGSAHRVTVASANVTGELTVTVGNSSAKTRYYDSSITGSDIYLGLSEIGGDVTIATGNANVQGSEVTGNDVTLSDNMLLGNLDIQNGNAKSSSTGGYFSEATGNQVTIGRYSTNTIAGDVTITNGNGAATLSFSNYRSAVGNNAVIASSTSIDGNVSITNGSGKATLNGFTYGSAIGNIGRVGSDSVVSGDVTITNGNGKAIGKPTISDTYYALGSVIANVSSLGSNVTVGGSVSFETANGSAVTKSNSAIGNSVSVGGSDITGAVNVTLGTGKASTKSSSAVGNVTRLFGGAVLGDVLTIHHGTGSSKVGSGNSRGSEIELGNNSIATEVVGAISVTQGSSKAAGGDAVDSTFEVRQLMAMSSFTLNADKGDNELTVGDSAVVGTFTANLGAGNDLLQLEDSVFSATVLFAGSSGTDTFESIGMNSFAIGPPTLTDVEVEI